ncbi:MAG: D-alanine--D-alanine ligase [Candidatus Cloacimonadota bacterium]|nr:MAG: D-alanine--D-alanine ligase [Candidatus Cloacimonadota bacterium]
MMDFRKKRIGVLMGGWSSEREISLMSGKNILASLKRQGFDAVGIDMVMGMDFFTRFKKEEIDIVFNILHGKPGEDGTVQGLLELLGIPYTGSGLLASAIAMNKVMTKRILLREGILTPNFYVVDEWKELKKSMKEAVEKVGFPMFIKPEEEGSSVGADIIRVKKGIKKKFVKERERYRTFLVEEYIKGMIATCGVLGTGKDAYSLPVLELVPEKKFYDYEAKYTKGMTEFIIPARLAQKITEITKRMALETHRIIGCRGFSRVDFVIKDNEIPYVLEINTIPGMTKISDLPAEAEKIGISYDELVMEILKSSKR